MLVGGGIDICHRTCLHGLDQENGWWTGRLFSFHHLYSDNCLPVIGGNNRGRKCPVYRKQRFLNILFLFVLIVSQIRGSHCFPSQSFLQLLVNTTGNDSKNEEIIAEWCYGNCIYVTTRMIVFIHELSSLPGCSFCVLGSFSSDTWKKCAPHCYQNNNKKKYLDRVPEKRKRKPGWLPSPEWCSSQDIPSINILQLFTHSAPVVTKGFHKPPGFLPSP